MTPAQMEGFRTYYYEYHFLYITGIQSVDSKSIQGAALMNNLFREERRPDYNALIQEVHKLDRSAQGFPNQLAKMKQRFDEISEIDFFGCPLRSVAEEALYKAEHPATPHVQVTRGRLSKMAYQKRGWITRPRPGIDRCLLGMADPTIYRSQGRFSVRQ
jgi:hypothetical protein